MKTVKFKIFQPINIIIILVSVIASNIFYRDDYCQINRLKTQKLYLADESL